MSDPVVKKPGSHPRAKLNDSKHTDTPATAHADVKSMDSYKGPDQQGRSFADIIGGIPNNDLAFALDFIKRIQPTQSTYPSIWSISPPTKPTNALTNDVWIPDIEIKF